MKPHRIIKTDYLSGAEELAPYYQYPINDPDFRQIAADKAKDPINRQLLSDRIRSQYVEAGIEVAGKVAENLDRLAREDSFTITTGHQLVMFGGPLFTVYKVSTVIKLADQLTASGMNVVPVFWIHTEDHDFEEINHYYQSFLEKRTYPGTFSSDVGSHVLEPSIEEIHPNTLPETLIHTFKPGVPLKTAYRRFFHHLYESYGLLMLDASDEALKARFSEVAKRELQEHFTEKAVNQQTARLQAGGYKEQIHPREINLFYLDAEGRNRIIKEGDRIQLVDRDLSFSEAEFLAEMEQNPNGISPNVCLRPLYQEMILPNLAYVGGWGELSYWLQLKEVFEEAKINFPLLLPRMSATVLDEETADSWKKMGFEIADIKLPLARLNDRYLPQIWDQGEMRHTETKILDLMSELESYIHNHVSVTLARSADALSTKTRNFLANLEKKAGKIKRQENREPFEQIKALKSIVEPDQQVQERVLSLPAVGNWIDPYTFLQLVYEQCRPLSYEHQFLILPK